MTIRLIALVLIAVSVNIFAQAGTPYELSKIKFTGNEKISGSDLELIISSEETPWWFYKFINSFSPLGSPAVYFDSANVRMDIDALKKYYEDNGFFKAKINAVIEKDTAAKTISLTYNIEENAQSRFGVITYRGIESLPDNIEQRIYSETMINPDLFYKKSLIDQNMDHVLEILLNRGYMYVMWDSTSIYKDTSANTAGVEMCFSTGNRFKISEIQVVKRGEGATGVDDNMLRNLTGIQKEEYYNNQKIKTAQARLVRTGLFHQINFQPARRDTSGDYVPLKLDGNIGLMNEFLPGISVNNEFKSFNLGLSASYTRKNFLGNARKLTLTSELSVVDIAHFSFNEFFSSHNNLVDGYALLNLKLEQPYLFQQPINGILENYFQTSTRNAVNNKTYGIKATFDFEMPYYTFINQLSPFFNLEFYDAKITDYVRQNFIYFRKANIFSRTSFLGVQFGSAKADNVFFPTSGNNQLINLETAISFGEANINAYYVNDKARVRPISYQDKSTTLFYRVEYTSTFYKPMSKYKTAVLATKFKVGYVHAFTGNTDLIPGNRTFFAGGANSVRGWGIRDLPLYSSAAYDSSNPLGYLVNNDTTDQKVRGGMFLLEGSFEFRQRFFESFGVAFFADYGNAWDSYKLFRFDYIAVAAGFGIRYYSPIAPFRLDVGLKFYDPGNKLFIWDNWNPHILKNLTFQFSIGEAF